MDLKITHAGLYTTPETFRQITPCTFLGLNCSGLDYMKIYSPAGMLVAEAGNEMLVLIPEGFLLDFSYHSSRKNYIIMCRIEGLNWNEQTQSVELNFNDQKIEVPLVIPVPLVRKEPVQELFHRTIRLSESALPADSKAAELLMSSVLAEFLEHSSLQKKQNPPPCLADLKEAIDSDFTFQKSLKKIISGIPMTEIHLRRLFQKYYQTTPAEYRARLRFSRIRQLLTETDLSLKEIADAVGMNHVTHLHLFLKKRCDMTPAELRKNLRM